MCGVESKVVGKINRLAASSIVALTGPWLQLSWCGTSCLLSDLVGTKEQTVTMAPQWLLILPQHQHVSPVGFCS